MNPESFSVLYKTVGKSRKAINTMASDPNTHTLLTNQANGYGQGYLTDLDGSDQEQLAYSTPMNIYTQYGLVYPTVIQTKSANVKTLPPDIMKKIVSQVNTVEQEYGARTN